MIRLVRESDAGPTAGSVELLKSIKTAGLKTAVASSSTYRTIKSLSTDSSDTEVSFTSLTASSKGYNLPFSILLKASVYFLLFFFIFLPPCGI